MTIGIATAAAEEAVVHLEQLIAKLSQLSRRNNSGREGGKRRPKQPAPAPGNGRPGWNWAVFMVVNSRGFGG